MMSLIPYCLAFFCIVLNLTSQILLKMGMSTMGSFDYTLDRLVPGLIKAFMSPVIIFGLFLYALSFMVWLIVLSKLEVVLAYSLLSLGYVIMPVIGWFFLGERLSLGRFLGAGIIMIGVYFVSKN